jgi:putative transposase
MSRPLRIEYEGAWYHVMNRGRRSERIFDSLNDYLRFVELLTEATELWDVRISAYCLMANHYHLLIQTPQGNLSRCMRHINSVYTQRFNRTHGTDGPLFRGRFKSIIVDGDSYLLQLIRYIHRNPQRAGVVKQLDDYLWSSHKGYLSSAKKWDWIHKEFILSMLSDWKGNRLKAYKQFMAMEDSEEITDMFERNKWPTFLGDETFVRWLKGKYFERKSDSQIPESVTLAPELEAIKKVVCSYYHMDESELLKSRRGCFNEPRSMAIYLVRMLRKDGLKDIGSAFGLRGYSSTSSILDGMRKQIQKNSELKKRFEEIKREVVISQTET